MANTMRGLPKGTTSTLYQMAFQGWLSALTPPIDLPDLKESDMFGVFVQTPVTHQLWRFLRLHLKVLGLEAASYNLLVETMAGAHLKRILAKANTLEEAWASVNQLKLAKAEMERAFDKFVAVVNKGEPWGIGKSMSESDFSESDSDSTETAGAAGGGPRAASSSTKSSKRSAAQKAEPTATLPSSATGSVQPALTGVGGRS